MNQRNSEEGISRIALLLLNCDGQKRKGEAAKKIAPECIPCPAFEM